MSLMPKFCGCGGSSLFSRSSINVRASKVIFLSLSQSSAEGESSLTIMTAVGLEEQAESVSSFSLYSSCRMPTLGAQTPCISGPNSQTLSGLVGSQSTNEVRAEQDELLPWPLNDLRLCLRANFARNLDDQYV